MELSLGLFLAIKGPKDNHFVKKSACLNVVLGWVSIMQKILGLKVTIMAKLYNSELQFVLLVKTIKNSSHCDE